MTTTREMADLIAATMADVIGGGAELSPDDSFFDKGGHSLGAMKLLGRLRRQGLELDMPVILEQKTPAKIAEHITGEPLASSTGSETIEPLVADEVLRLSSGEGTPLFCFHSIVGLAWSYAPLAKRVGGMWPVIGIQMPTQDKVMEIGFEHDDLCRYYIGLMKKEQPEGPYRLLGYSSGGAIAHTIAGMLQADGETVEYLGIIDSYPSGIQPDCPGGVASVLQMFLGTKDGVDSDHQHQTEQGDAADSADPADPWADFEKDDDGGFGDLAELSDEQIQSMIQQAGAPEFAKEDIHVMLEAAGRCLMYYLSAKPWDYAGSVDLILAGGDAAVPGIIWEPEAAWRRITDEKNLSVSTVDFSHMALVSDAAWAAMAPGVMKHLLALG